MMMKIVKNQKTMEAKRQANTHGRMQQCTPCVRPQAAKHQLKIAVLYTEPATGKRALAHCTCNFTRHEDMASYEEEFGKASKDLGISDKLKAKVMGASLEIQERFYYR